MGNKKITRGEPLKATMLDLNVGDVLEVPFKLFSANSIRATASQLKSDKGVAFEVNARGEKVALVKRTQ